MVLEWPPHDPNAELDYHINWKKLNLGDDTIDSAVFTPATAAGVVLGAQTNTDEVATVWISGGTMGAQAFINCRVFTNGGRTLDQTMALPISGD